MLAKIVDKKTINDIAVLKMKINDSFKYKAGQFIMLETELGKRAYSIASAPKNNEIELCIKKVGNVSAMLYNAKVNDCFEIKGPFGHFCDSGKKIKKYYAATGTGIAPIKAMIESLIEDKDIEIVLFYSAKRKSDLVYDDYFKKMESDKKNFKYIPILSREENYTQKGHIQDFFSIIKDANKSEIYICGLKDAVKEIKEKALEIGFKKENIFFELY